MKSNADLEITTRVRRAFCADPELVGLPIHISVVQRFVRLMGHVPTMHGRERAAATAAAVAGVREVRNGLEVR